MPELHPVVQFNGLWQHHVERFGAFKRSDFHPMSVPQILPWFIVLDIENQGTSTARYKYRLYGSGIADVFATDLTGAYVGEQIAGKLKAQLEREFSVALSTMNPQFSVTNVPMPDREFIEIYRGVFPATADDNNSQQLIVIMADVQRRIAPIDI